MQISARLKVQTIQLQKKIVVLREQLKQANAKVAQLEMKPEEGESENETPNKSDID